MINPMELTGKHILVTGASSGIGRETAILCSQLGATVSIVARRETQLQETMHMMEGTSHKIYIQDLSDLTGIEELVKRATADSGVLDGIVHCAGIGQNRSLSLTKPEFIQETLAVTFYSFAELIRIASKKKYSKDGSSFVGISSVASIRGDKAQGAYAAAKAAMNGLIHPYAKELGGRKIRLNTVAFGMIRTEMYQSFQLSGGTEGVLQGQYLGIGEPRDAANVIAFLLSDASRFITGTTLIADGGYLS